MQVAVNETVRVVEPEAGVTTLTLTIVLTTMVDSLGFRQIPIRITSANGTAEGMSTQSGSGLLAQLTAQLAVGPHQRSVYTVKNGSLL